MAQRTLELPRGRGRIVGEGFTANVSYALVVSEEQIEAGNNPDATIRGLKTIDGRLEFENPAEEVRTFGKLFTLHLDDGRRLKILTIGSRVVKGTGGFY